MDFNRPWTIFALEAEHDAYGMERIARQHNSLRDALIADATRYRWLRKLNVEQFKELYRNNIETGEHFDALIDAALAKDKP